MGIPTLFNRMGVNANIAPPPIDENDYFCFIATADNSAVALNKVNAYAPDVSLQYSKDKVKWKTYNVGVSIPLGAEEKVYFRGNNTAFSTGSGANKFSASGQVKVGGNAMSLLDKKCQQTELSSNYAFTNLFANNTSLTDASELKLPATTVTTRSYVGMFAYCTSLSAAPILSAMTVGNSAYGSMFYGCTSLSAAPALPATTLSGNNNYTEMFRGCTSLTTAPALPVSSLTQDCYSNMFRQCTSLSAAPELPATTLAPNCYSSMFRDCYSLKKAPALKATTLPNYCYSNMFWGCSGMTEMNVDFTYWPDVSTTHSTQYWVTGVSPTGVFFCPSALNAEYSDSKIPNGWTKVAKDNVPFNITAENDYTTVSLYYVGSLETVDNGYEEQGEGWYEDQEQIYHPAETHWDDELQEEVVDVEEWWEDQEPLYHEGETQWVPMHEALPPLNLEYSTDLITWQSAEFTPSNVDPINGGGSDGSFNFIINHGETVYLRGTNERLYSDPNTYAYFYADNSIKVGGNAMSLLDATVQQTEAPSTCFQGLFKDCTYLTDAESLQLPATTLGNGCYYQMFKGCTSLSAAPSVLPAPTLEGACYREMFKDCSALVKAPALRATTLAQYCYYGMFQGCTALSTMPSIGAATYYPNYSCAVMFKDCTSLSSADPLRMNTVTSFDNYACASMFAGCTSLTTPIATMGKSDGSTVMGQGAASNMYMGCTSLNVLEDYQIYGMLPAQTLSGMCYEGMFQGCTALTRAPYLPATTVPGYAYSSMFEGCSSLNDIYYGIDATTYDGNMCCSRMFKDCTSLVYAPTIEATTLGYKTYNSMFDGCSSLNHITVRFTDWNESDQSTANWLNGVASTGTFYCPSNLDTTTRDASHVPDGWTVAAS